ncbi:hypothetical protein [Nonomuraea sp. NPDC049784]|uniref:hypothetical protein n=1 Tax=Nonomuraea sp. NPDC049784 TaxID=3154361 RepID=UPI0033F7F0E2
MTRSRLMAAMGWEQVAVWLGGELTDKAWAAVLPAMSYRQRLARLRSFEAAQLVSPEESHA